MSGWQTHRQLKLQFYYKAYMRWQLRVFVDDRIPTLDIDYGKHRGKKSLHVHYYKDGVRGSGNDVVVLHPGDALYERYKRYFKGVI